MTALCARRALPFLLLLGSSARGAAPPAAAPAHDLVEYRAGASLALQGDLEAALTHLQTVAPSALTEDQRRTWSCMRERFASATPTPPPADLDRWSGSVLAAYRAYWHRAMLHPAERQAAELALAGKLAELLRGETGAGVRPSAERGRTAEKVETSAAATVEALEPALEAKFREHGLHALLGRTPPLCELMLWRAEDERTYDVDLPTGLEHVRVEMLDGFSSLGWAGYATCDTYHSAGWSATDRLYCVRPSYDLESEAFRTSYLAHEAQHFADKRHFPKLEAPELEYRAKLVEIARADTTLLKLLGAFTANVSESRDQPHPYANRRLVRALAQAVLGGAEPTDAAWNAADPARVRAAALRLLDEDTRRLGAAP